LRSFPTRRSSDLPVTGRRRSRCGRRILCLTFRRRVERRVRHPSGRRQRPRDRRSCHSGDRRVIRRLILAGIISAVTTFVGALSVRASGVVLAVGCVAAVTVLATWLCPLHSTDEESGLALANPAWALGLTLTRRFNAAFLIPVAAAQIIGAVIAGAAALGLQTSLPDQMIWSHPSYTVAVA